MKKLQNAFIIMGLVLTLGLSTSGPATAASRQSMEAAVTVFQYTNTTVLDNTPLGLSFGTILPGTTKKAEETQGKDIGALGIRLEVESNAYCEINAKADDFISKTDIMAVDNIEWNTEDDSSAAVAMTKEYAKVGVIAKLETQNIWYWLSIPENQVPGDYTSSFLILTRAVNEAE